MAKISRVDAFPVSIPLTKPMRLASETVSTARNLIVRIVDSDGVAGWGECASAPTMNGELLEGMVAAARQRLAPCLIGQDLSRDTLPVASSRMDRAIFGNTGAKSAVDIALHDLVARQLGVPLHTLLGTPAAAFAIIRTLGSGDDASDFSEAQRLAVEGFTHFKLKVGQRPVEEDIAFVRRMRRALNACRPDLHLALDANMAWDATTAEQFVAGVADLEIAYLEQPVADDEQAMAKVAHSGTVDLCLDEGLHDPRDIATYAHLGAVRGVGLKLLKFGRIETLRKAADLASHFRLNVTLACKIAESSIGAAASLHLASLCRSAEWGVSLTHQYLSSDTVTVPIPHAGFVRVPDGVGLGIDVDEQAVRSLNPDLAHH